MLQLTLPVAVLFGAMVSPTDPVAVTAVFRRIGVPSRLIDLVESESHLNDGTGVVVFSIALTGVEGGRLELGSAVLVFLQLALGGSALGVAVGLILSVVTSRLDDPQVEITPDRGGGVWRLPARRLPPRLAHPLRRLRRAGAGQCGTAARDVGAYPDRHRRLLGLRLVPAQLRDLHPHRP